ncbi:MAG: nucleoside kinase [Clostridia bacterium]|nr:nucleoside kinase [Clostridia bacterium]
MTFYCLDHSLSSDASMRVLDILSAMGFVRRDILAVLVDGEVRELTDTLSSDATLRPLTLANEEGRRIYERSLRFVMLLALRHLFPGARVRVEYSVCGGILVRLPGKALSTRDVRRIAEEMHLLCEKDLPFTHAQWTTEEALAYFTEDGQTDKAVLLSHRPIDHIRMYQCEDMSEYFYGAMVPSTGYVPIFDLLLHGNGFVLQLPNAASPLEPAPYFDRPRHLAAFDQSARWCSILGVENVTDLSLLIEKKQLRPFIRVNEALHDQAIIDIARSISTARRRIVLVAGPSSSGKTTFSGRLAVQLQVLGHRAVRVSLDNYYRNRDQIPREPDGSVDLEHIRAIDVPLIQAQMQSLLAGEEVMLPIYSFQTKSRDAQGIPLHLGANDIVIFEGIHALNPVLTEHLPADQIHRVFVSALTCLNLDDHNRIRTTDVRLLRRLVRDHQFRNTDPRDTFAMWESVRRGEETWIFPFQENADSVFNTTLHYELPILAHYARPLLQIIGPSDPGYLFAFRLRKMLNYLPAVDPEIFNEIPPLSLLREFIGGCTIDET